MNKQISRKQCRRCKNYKLYRVYWHGIPIPFYKIEYCYNIKSRSKSRLVCDFTNLKHLKFCGDYTEQTDTLIIEIEYKDMSKPKESA